MSAQQKPLELILARNLISVLSTAAFLVDVPGQIIFFNEAAGTLLGRRFEETGPISQKEWRVNVGPFDAEGNVIPFMELPLTVALRKGTAAHTRHLLRPATTEALCEYDMSGVPIISTGGGFRGAMVFFWSSDDDVR